LVLRGHLAPVNAVAFDGDGARLATAGDDATFRVWDAATGQHVQTIASQSQRAWCVAFSPDGTRLATSGFNGTASVWDLATGRERFSLPGHTGSVQITYSRDGTRLATSSAGGTSKVWDAFTGRELLSLRLPGGGATCAALSPDRSRLAVASTDALARVYLVRLEDLVTLARARLTRSWTLDECQRFLHLERSPG
jgi:WD40 repeat protein